MFTKTITLVQNTLYYLVDVKEKVCWQERVWGVAYQIGAEDVERVSQYLDYREKDGYQRTETTFYPHCDKQIIQ